VCVCALSACGAQVYTKNRCLRTVGSSKIGSVTPFVLLGASGESEAALRLQSLASQPGAAPYVYVDAADKPAALPAGKKRRKPSADGAGAPAGDGLGSLQHDPAPVAADTLPEHFTRLFVRECTQVKRMPLSASTPPSEIPPAVRLQLLHGAIALEDVSKFYIEGPKQCPADLITGQRHTHSNNNALAVVVRYGAAPPDVYVKCFCDCRARLAKIHRPTGQYREMPKVEGTVKLVLETVWGLGNVLDRADREAVIGMFQLADPQMRERLLAQPDKLVRWTRILPMESWCFIPVATTMGARMALPAAAAMGARMALPAAAAMGARMALPAAAAMGARMAPPAAAAMGAHAAQKRARAKPVADAPAPGGAPALPRPSPPAAAGCPTVLVCPFVGERYEVLCPLCVAIPTTTAHFDGARLRTYGSVSGVCAAGHAYRVRISKAR